MRKKGKIDANQNDIVRALRDIGASVQILSSVGNGCPDIMVGFYGKNFLFEIKNPKLPKSKRKLTKEEALWIGSWKGQVHIIEYFQDAFLIINRRTNR